MKDPLTVYVIRHGVTPWNKENLCMGQKDIPLDEEGHAQARRLAGVFANLPVDRILCSDLMRTQQTAAPLAKIKKLTPVLDPRLREISYGVLEGTAPEDWKVLHPELMKIWDYSSVDQAPPGGESRGELMARCAEVLEELAVGDDRHVALVTHGGVVMALLTYVIFRSVHLPLTHSLGVFKVHNASVTTLTFQKGRWRIVEVNRTYPAPGNPESGGL